jgi:hypothetical protein
MLGVGGRKWGSGLDELKPKGGGIAGVELRIKV